MARQNWTACWTQSQPHKVMTCCSGVKRWTSAPTRTNGHAKPPHLAAKRLCLCLKAQLCLQYRRTTRVCQLRSMGSTVGPWTCLICMLQQMQCWAWFHEQMTMHAFGVSHICPTNYSAGCALPTYVCRSTTTRMVHAVNLQCTCVGWGV